MEIRLKAQQKRIAKQIKSLNAVNKGIEKQTESCNQVRHEFFEEKAKMTALEKQKKAIKQAKQKGVTKSNDLSKLEAEVKAFNEALANMNPQQQQVIIQNETQEMLKPKAAPSTAGKTQEQIELDQKMEVLNDKILKAASPVEQQQAAEEQKRTIIAAKQRGLTKSGDPADAAREIEEFKAALAKATSAPQEQAIIQTEAKAMTEPRHPYFDSMSSDQLNLKEKMLAYVAAMQSAKTPQQQYAIAEKQKEAVAEAKKQGLTKSGDASDGNKELIAFLELYNKQTTAQQQQAVVMNEAKQMLESNTEEVAAPQSAEMMDFEARMKKLDKAMKDAKTPAQKKAIIDSEAKSILKAKKSGITRADRQLAKAESDVQEFIYKLNEALTLQEQEALIQAEAQSMLATEPVADDSRFERELDVLNTSLARAKSPEQQFAILEQAKQNIIKEKRAKKGLPKTYDASNDSVYAEIARFNAALLAAQSAREKQALIDAEKAVLLKPQYQVPADDDRWAAFETEMSALNSALASAKTRREQNQLLEEQQKAVIKAKKRGLTKADESEAQMIAEIAAFNSALLAAETARQQQELIDIERRALLKAQKAIQVKNAEQEVFEAEMTGYDEAYASAQSDLEKLTILEAQKQAIVKAKKKGVTKAQKAAKEGRKLNDQQVRLDILEAELVALKAALARAESEVEKRAVIDAEKNALIEAKKEVARTESVLAEGEVDLAKVSVEPMKPTKLDKRAERKAKRLAKKHEEEEAPIPHNKRGKISEKTLDSGTVK